MPPVTIRNLTERRLPQYLAIYLGASWGLIQFVDFLTSRYGLSPRWTDLTLLAVALLLPSVILYIYHHGRPGRDEWQRSEKIFIPINVVLLAVVLTLVGSGTNLDAVTTRVRVKDEKGNTIEAVVPTKAYRKRVALFKFDGATDAASRWLQFGVPWLVFQDIQQQQFVELVPHFALRTRLQEAGYADGVEVPLALKRKIASEMHVPHFIAGTVSRGPDGVTAHVQIYETSSAKLLKEETITAPTAAELSDLISERVLKGLEIPVLTDAKPDLPITELLSKNPEALRAYVEAQDAIQSRDDWATAVSLAARAVELDPTFAEAQRTRYVTALFSNQPAVAGAAIQAALDHSYRMPERMQYFTKAEYYFAKQDYQRAYAVLDMVSKLYPEDLQILQQMVVINQARDNKDALIVSLKKVLELDPTRAEMIQQLGSVYEAKGDAAAALEQYEEYARRFPEEPRSARAIANLNRRTGNLPAARSAYEQALVAKPNDVETLVQFALLERTLGDFPAAELKYEQALANSKTPAERSTVLEGMVELAAFRGQITKAVEINGRRLAEIAKTQPPVMVQVSKLSMMGRYAQLSPDRGRRELASVRKQLTAPFDMYLPLGEIQLFGELGEADSLERAVVALDKMIQQSGLKALQASAFNGRARLNELRGNYAAALQAYTQQAALQPFSVDIKVAQGRCNRKLGKHKEAEKLLGEALRVAPAHGDANLEMALLYKATGDAARAKQHADRARTTWQAADPNYKLLAELNSI